MWPGLKVPTLAGLKGGKASAAEDDTRESSKIPPASRTSPDEEAGELNSRVMLRVFGGGKSDLIIPARSLDKLPAEPGLDDSNLRDILEENALGNIPGFDLGHLTKHGKQGLPVCISGDSQDDVEAVAKRCESLGMKPVVLSSNETTKMGKLGREKEEADFAKPQQLMVTEGGKNVPYLKPRTSLKPEERQKLRLPAASRRSGGSTGPGKLPSAPGKAQLVDDESAEKARALKAKTSLLRQINSVVMESFASASLVDDMPMMRGTGATSALNSMRLKAPGARVRSSLQEVAQGGKPLSNVALEVEVAEEGEADKSQTLVQPPPEISLVHEQLAASAASALLEFPSGTVPPERRAGEEGDKVGAIRAMAVRIRGSAASAYPFMKAGSASGQQDSFTQNGMLSNDGLHQADPQGIQE